MPFPSVKDVLRTVALSVYTSLEAGPSDSGYEMTVIKVTTTKIPGVRVLSSGPPSEGVKNDGSICILPLLVLYQRNIDLCQVDNRMDELCIES